MREGKSGWKCICKCFVNYRWKGLTGGELCDIIEMSRKENEMMVQKVSE